MPLNILLFGAIAVFLISVVTALFQWLWNITMPDMFRLKRITYWQAFRLLILAVMRMREGTRRHGWGRL